QRRRWEELGLPASVIANCQLKPADALTLQTCARNLRVQRLVSLPARNGSLSSPRTGVDAQARLQTSASSVPALIQMLQPEEDPTRSTLVTVLARNPRRDSTIALGKLALFDPPPEIREMAVQALDRRPREQYRKVLLDGLRYPWAPVADHAAEALVALKD